MTGTTTMEIDQEENLSPSELAAQIAMRQSSGKDAKNLIFSPFKHDDRQMELSRAAQAHRQRMENERKAKNHLLRNRQALKEKQQHNRNSIREKQAREYLKLQQREREKNDLYGAVKSRVFDKDYAALKTAASSSDGCPFSLSSSHKSYGKVPRYISDRKAQIERERDGIRMY